VTDQLRPTDLILTLNQSSWCHQFKQSADMKIQIDAHTLERAEERGANESEIVDVITTGVFIDAKYGRIGKAKVFEFGRERHGKFFEQKRVEVYYVMEGEMAVTVTVYAFYGKWED
jgi:oxalate decarboxylase/phosphoglucose isomerase-like protein (cupin superfamily)